MLSDMERVMLVGCLLVMLALQCHRLIGIFLCHVRVAHSNVGPCGGFHPPQGFSPNDG